MTPHAATIWKHFLSLDAMLVAAGWPPTSKWWRTEIRRFYTSGTRQWVIRAGRRAGKSSTLCRLAYTEARWGKHEIPPGDLGFVMFISRDRDEAAQRLRTIDQIAAVVGDRLEVKADERIFATGRTGFKVFTATVAGVSGPTSIMVIGDELSKWRDSETGANPASDVIASAAPTTATQPEARRVWSSSPLGLEDAHARMFDLGTTKHQFTSFAETWVANPTVTEEATHELEPDERVWAREYAAVPQASALSAFDVDAIDLAIASSNLQITKAGAPVMVIDPSSGRADAWTWCVVDRVETGDKRMFRLSAMDGIEGRFWQQTTGEKIVERLAAICAARRIRDVHGDQREALMIESAFRAHEIRYHVHDWTSGSKVEAVERVRRWMADGNLILPPHDKLRRQLLSLREKITPNGSITFGARGHDDYAALVITAAMVDMAHGVCAYEQPVSWAKMHFEAAKAGREAQEARDWRRDHFSEMRTADGKLVGSFGYTTHSETLDGPIYPRR